MANRISARQIEEAFETALCGSCRLEKPKVEFSPDRRSAKRGVQSFCKKCSYARRKTRRGIGDTIGAPRKQHVDGVLVCCRCKIAKPLDAFALCSKAWHGRRSYCKVCDRERHQEWRKANPRTKQESEKRWAWRLRGEYGLSVSDYHLILQSQGGGCAICGATQDNHKRKMPVDHDHATGKVRGVLCGPCNSALGSFRDSSTVASAAVAYLRKHGK